MTDSNWWDRGNFGRLARILGLIGFFLSFAGVAVLGFALFAAITEVMMSGFGSFPFGGGSGFSLFDPMMGIGFVLSPAIKAFACFFCLFGLALISSQERRKAGGVLFIICGTIMVPPIVFGGLFSTVLELYGILPFIPHFISGSLLIAAGVLAFAWIPPEEPGLTITATIDYTPTPEPTVCPNCRTPLIGNERFCPGCGKTIKSS